mgnify:CR=1 FL=1
MDAEQFESLCLDAARARVALIQANGRMKEIARALTAATDTATAALEAYTAARNQVEWAANRSQSLPPETCILIASRHGLALGRAAEDFERIHHETD